MGLKLSKVNSNLGNKKINRKFESMGKKLLLIRLDILPKHCSPFHWLLENGRKPPFDIAINPEDASISYIKFFFQDEKVQLIGDIIKEKRQQDGLPYFDISNFSEKRYQIFENGEVKAFLDEKKLYLSISNVEVFQFLNLDDNNAILFDENGFCAGVLFKNLLENELGELLRSDVLPII